MILICAIVSLGLMALTPSQSVSALGGNCSARMVSGVGYTVARGRCVSLNRDTKARSTLDIAAAPDTHSAWFTDYNKDHDSTPWVSGYPGFPRAARIDYGVR
ncbi:hypothetical protein ACFQY8_00225 [Alloscardovia venturai]|uniref:Secreted protein n=1 Tax=Alloscardovia venturai TaxID=1769421 RepID=A0ABW2Y1R0_9BIFI